MVWLIRFIGISEILGAVGLILPSLLRIRPSLTVAAAWALALVMLLALPLLSARGVRVADRTTRAPDAVQINDNRRPAGVWRR